MNNTSPTEGLMHSPTSRIISFLAVAFLAPAVFAASFVVPSDRELIRRAQAIVIATPLPSYTQINDEGGIETVTSIRIEEILKGAGIEDSLTIVEPGGEYGGHAMVIPGVPRFATSERTLLFLVRTGRDRWAVTELVLGKFTFERDDTLLRRDLDEISAWDSGFTPHVEQPRDTARFLAFIRVESRGGMGKEDYFSPDTSASRERTKITTSFQPVPTVAPFTATSYTMFISGTRGGRWAAFPVTFFSGTTQEPGAPGGGSVAITTAFNSWNNDCQSNVNYVYGGTDNGTHTQGLHASDGANTILFERDLSSFGVSPFTCSANGYSGTLGIGGITVASGTNTVGSETFATTQEADVEMNKGIANCALLFNNGDWNSAVTHEVGHTLGFRHSDQTRDSSAACTSDPSLECSQQAIMKSFISTGLNAALQVWDQHAVQAVYPGNVCVPNSCTAPAITSQPQSGTIRVTSGATLTVGATGTSLTYQWYFGASGNTSNPIPGGTGPSVDVAPQQTTSYWVRVSNSCGTVNSATATVTVVAAAPAAKFFLLTPCRALDTRGGGAIGAGQVRTMTIAGACGVPSGATALAVNVTAVLPASDGYVALYPGPQITTRPYVSTLNFTPGRTLANNARVALGADGTLNIFNAGSSPLDILIDISGYFK
jgi:hypothetical protein